VGREFVESENCWWAESCVSLRVVGGQSVSVSVSVPFLFAL